MSCSSSVGIKTRIHLMPYIVIQKDGKFEVKNTDTGKIHSKTTKTKAEAQIRLLRGLEHGFTPSLLPIKQK